MPAGRPRFKQTAASEPDRLSMLELMTQSQPRLAVSTHEFEWARMNPSRPNTTYDTLTTLSKDGREYAFVIGLDQFSKLEQWHRFPEVMSLCHWIVLVRKPSTLDEAVSVAKAHVDLGILRSNGISTAAPEFEIVTGKTTSGSGLKRLIIAETRARNISSTEIRAEIARTGLPPEGTISSAVLAYLKDKKLYGT